MVATVKEHSEAWATTSQTLGSEVPPAPSQLFISHHTEGDS